MSQPSVSRSIHKTVDVLLEHMHGLVRFPQDEEEITRVKQGFYEKFGMPGVIGCVDGTHIAINGVFLPLGNLELPRLVFLNRKGFFSVNCQIVCMYAHNTQNVKIKKLILFQICDSDLKILNLNARFPGSVHDAAIWQQSDIQDILWNRYFHGN